VGHVKNALIERFVWLEAILQTLEHEMANGKIDKAESLGRWIQASTLYTVWPRHSDRRGRAPCPG